LHKARLGALGAPKLSARCLYQVSKRI